MFQNQELENIQKQRVSVASVVNMSIGNARDPLSQPQTWAAQGSPKWPGDNWAGPPMDAQTSSRPDG